MDFKLARETGQKNMLNNTREMPSTIFRIRDILQDKQQIQGIKREREMNIKRQNKHAPNVTCGVEGTSFKHTTIKKH